LPEEGALPPEVALSVVAEAEAALPAEEEPVAVADFEILSTPAYLAGNQHVLLRHNQTFSVFVQPELQASAPSQAVV